jgi:hypothetical protein
MGQLADAAVCLRDPERAARVYERLSPYGHLFDLLGGDGFPTGPVALWLAELATTMGQYAAAEKWLDAADALNHRLGATLFAQYAALARAKLLLARDPTDLVAAGKLLRSVVAFAERKRLAWLSICAGHVEQAFFSSGRSRAERRSA